MQIHDTHPLTGDDMITQMYSLIAANTTVKPVLEYLICKELALPEAYFSNPLVLSRACLLSAVVPAHFTPREAFRLSASAGLGQVGDPDKDYMHVATLKWLQRLAKKSLTQMDWNDALVHSQNLAVTEWLAPSVTNPSMLATAAVQKLTENRPDLLLPIVAQPKFVMADAFLKLLLDKDDADLLLQLALVAKGWSVSGDIVWQLAQALPRALHGSNLRTLQRVYALFNKVAPKDSVVDMLFVLRAIRLPHMVVPCLDWVHVQLPPATKASVNIPDCLYEIARYHTREVAEWFWQHALGGGAGGGAGVGVGAGAGAGAGLGAGLWAI
jgi:hypothetical protein